MTELPAALLIASEVARAAGRLIRAEFHRSGGPRGAGDHADVDVAVERLIWGRLRAAFPAWRYQAARAGSDGPVDASLRWEVTPHDGADRYLLGWRGSAVSIALQRGDEPLLAVVYTPLAPDDAGDLFTWAEGAPLRRNGVPLTRGPLPERLGPGDVVLVHADDQFSPAVVARAVAPARFRTVPSVAYLLALLAVGEGDACVAVTTRSAPAGGHALVRAAGGDLYDHNLQTVRAWSGNSAGGWLFAGTAAAAATLKRGAWLSSHDHGEDDQLARRFSPAVATPGRTVADADRLRRAHGALLGQIAGDALGSLVEFESAAQIRRQYPEGPRELADGGTFDTIAGQPTDDSEMALMLARTLVRSAQFQPDAARAAYRAWLESGPFDIGGTTRRGLTGQPDHLSQANGSLMRISPQAVWGHALPVEALVEAARTDSRLTHPHPTPCDAVAAFVVAIAHAVREGGDPRAVYQAAVRWADDASADPSVRDTLRAAAAQPPADYLTNQGWVLVALQGAFYHLLHSSATEGVIASVRAGGDTDTNAAIAGALLGAVHGRDAFPASWRRAVLTCRPIAGLPGVHRPRPQPFWPVDYEVLAEQLLARQTS